MNKENKQMNLSLNSSKNTSISQTTNINRALETNLKEEQPLIDSGVSENVSIFSFFFISMKIS